MKATCFEPPKVFSGTLVVKMGTIRRTITNLIIGTALSGCAVNHLEPPQRNESLILEPMKLRLLVETNQLLVVSRNVDGTVKTTCLCGPRVAGGDIPNHVKDALVAAEDKRFYDHRGVDPLGLGRAFIQNVFRGRYAQGGSTITQQLCKNRILQSSKYLRRKGYELNCAIALELAMEKDEIIAAYLNDMYFGRTLGGRPIIGIEQAARTFFHKSTKILSLYEGAILVGMLKAPNH